MNLLERLLQNDILALILLMLVPLVPSLLLFGFLKWKGKGKGSTASISGEFVQTGPFKGFKYDISGAAAFYFILLFVGIYFTFQSRTRNQNTWRLEGKIEFPKVDPDFTFDDVQAHVNPKTFEVNDEGHFGIEFNLEPQLAAKTSITIEIPNFDSHVVYMVDKKIYRYHEREIDEANHIIYLKEPIVLQRNHNLTSK
jgi:hypothetical protein